ncbi:MAG: hypothetical protein ACOCOT_07150 [Prevotella sp.]|nr:hypothetical protein [Prevotella sp.]
MNKKLLAVFVIICLLLVGGLCYMGFNLRQQRKANADMQQLAELDKQEMENEYQQFSDQYSEMKTHVTNDSLISQLTAEQEKTERLLAELKRTKSSDAREIARLKRELATVRAVLRSYVIQIDSLNQANGRLTAENTRVKGQYEEATRQIEGLNTEKASLSEQVAIASQLDANGIQMHLLNKNNKAKDKISKARTIQVNFNIAKNVTAKTGMKTVYVRIMSPAGNIIGGGVSFPYENKTLAGTMKKTIEYNGGETAVSLYVPVSQTLSAGTYQVSVFAEGNMIGSKNFMFR